MIHRDADLPDISTRIRPKLFSRLFPALSFYYGAYSVFARAAKVVRSGRSEIEVFANASHEMGRIVQRIGGRIIVENADVLRRLEGPCVVAGNHMSSLETMVLPGYIMPIIPMAFVAKKILMSYPLVGEVLGASKPIIVGRENPREDLMLMTKEARDRLKQGISVVVFPQTTRTTEFSEAHFNSIGAKLAKREGVPLIPLALKTDLWGNGKRIKDIGKISPELDVHFRFGEPLDAVADEKAAHKACVQFIEDSLREWNAL